MQQHTLRLKKTDNSRKRRPIALCSNDVGYSVIDCPGLADFARELVSKQICLAVAAPAAELSDACELGIASFSKFKDKSGRLFGVDAALSFISRLNFEFNLQPDADFITDEEGLGIPNIYWRLVRAGNKSDVGSAHADKWFWDLGQWPLPLGYKRVKVWMPLIQDDREPSLMVLPGSHMEKHRYEFWEDPHGKKRPIFKDEDLIRRMVPAPVRMGQAVVFHDRLIHKGRPTNVNRMSLEWTFAIMD